MSWQATLNIWWASLWREVLGFFAIGFFGSLALKVLPALAEFGMTLLLLNIVVSWWMLLWATRVSLTDRYVGFSFRVESKHTGENLFGFSPTLGLRVVVPVWWAQTWRMALVPFAILFGTIAAALCSHRDVLVAIKMLDQPQAEHFTLLITMAASIWATRESLADRYRSFRVVTRERQFPT